MEQDEKKKRAPRPGVMLIDLLTEENKLQLQTMAQDRRMSVSSMIRHDYKIGKGKTKKAAANQNDNILLRLIDLIDLSIREIEIESLADNVKMSHAKRMEEAASLVIQLLKK